MHTFHFLRKDIEELVRIGRKIRGSLGDDEFVDESNGRYENYTRIAKPPNWGLFIFQLGEIDVGVACCKDIRACDSRAETFPESEVKKMKGPSREYKTFCRQCYEFVKSIQYCGVCKRIWHHSDGGGWVCCDGCDVWVHVECAGLSDRLLEDWENTDFYCPDCHNDVIVSMDVNILKNKRSDCEEHLREICEENDQSKVTDEEMLDKMSAEEEIKRVKEDVRLTKDSLIANMEYEKKLPIENLDNETSETLRKHEFWKRELETKMQNKIERENSLLEKIKAFDKEEGRELSNIDFLREVARKDMEELKQESLVTFALSYGGWSCPAARVYIASKVEDKLKSSKRDILRAALGISKVNQLMRLKMLNWYLLDFVEDMGSLLHCVCLRLSDEIQLNQVFNVLDLYEFVGADEGYAVKDQFKELPKVTNDVIEDVLDMNEAKSRRRNQYRKFLVKWLEKPATGSTWIVEEELKKIDIEIYVEVVEVFVPKFRTFPT